MEADWCNMLLCLNLSKLQTKSSKSHRLWKTLKALSSQVCKCFWAAFTFPTCSGIKTTRFIIYLCATGLFDFCYLGITNRITELANKNRIFCQTRNISELSVVWQVEHCREKEERLVLGRTFPGVSLMRGSTTSITSQTLPPASWKIQACTCGRPGSQQLVTYPQTTEPSSLQTTATWQVICWIANTVNTMSTVNAKTPAKITWGPKAHVQNK